jgi:crotonobetainyl-CoA:carnitine CoA-transferase CaiB-like acyl-CoA transferase
LTQDIWCRLSDVKVLDLTNELGYLCGKMLADLGADVIKIEPQGDDYPSDFYNIHKENTDAEGGLYYFAYNIGKRGITLNLNLEEGRNLFKKLVEKVDIVIESYLPGTMKMWGLDYEDLSRINPGLVYTSITPFGRTGPYRDNKVTDLVALAMGGMLFLTGDADRQPVRIGSPQAYLHAGSEACVGTMMALYHKETNGEGQLVDISVQQSIITTTFNAIPTWITKHTIVPRMGASRMVSNKLEMPLTWPCKDGHVAFSVFGGSSGGRTMKNLGEWMEEEGMGDKMVSDTDWGSFDFYGLTTAVIDKVSKPIARFFTNFTSEELFEESIKRGIMLFPVVSADYIVKDAHLSTKGFWQEIDLPEKEGTITFPSAPCRINGEYAPLKSRAPFKGEHNVQVYSELIGLSPQALQSLKTGRVI